jgi:hypothetical protein
VGVGCVPIPLYNTAPLCGWCVVVTTGGAATRNRTDGMPHRAPVGRIYPTIPHLRRRGGARSCRLRKRTSGLVVQATNQNGAQPRHRCAPCASWGVGVGDRSRQDRPVPSALPGPSQACQIACPGDHPCAWRGSLLPSRSTRALREGNESLAPSKNPTFNFQAAVTNAQVWARSAGLGTTFPVLLLTSTLREMPLLMSSAITMA